MTVHLCCSEISIYNVFYLLSEKFRVFKRDPCSTHKVIYTFFLGGDFRFWKSISFCLVVLNFVFLLSLDLRSELRAPAGRWMPYWRNWCGLWGAGRSAHGSNPRRRRPPRQGWLAARSWRHAWPTSLPTCCWRWAWPAALPSDRPRAGPTTQQPIVRAGQGGERKVAGLVQRWRWAVRAHSTDRKKGRHAGSLLSFFFRWGRGWCSSCWCCFSWSGRLRFVRSLPPSNAELRDC